MQDEKIISTININNYMVDEDALNLVIPGDLVVQQQGYINGHGTFKIGDKIYSSQVGVVQITNKLITVNPLKNKYVPQIGDIIVGRILQISNKRWKVDINSSSHCFLNLNSTYFPQQRKKNEEDQFNMRKIMQENDMIVAEVHSINADKSCNLHTRNPKYGRLEPGVIVKVQHKQIKRQKYHMISIGSIGLILGNNGWVWLSTYRRNDSTQQQKEKTEHNLQVMENITLLRNIIVLLGWENLEISENNIKQIQKFIQQNNIKNNSILQANSKIKDYLLEELRKKIPVRLDELAKKIKSS